VKQIKVALVHDYLNQMGGAEKVLEQFCQIFPDAPVYTSIFDKSKLSTGLNDLDIRSSFLQKLPFMKKHFKKYLPLYPVAFKRMKLSGYDVVLSMSSAFAKGISLDPETVHINYCLTPMRFAWMFESYNEKEKIPLYYKPILLPVFRQLKKWDLAKNKRVDKFVAISKAVQERIKRFYSRESDIIYPPVDFERFKPHGTTQDYFLIVSRLREYKRIDLAVSACTELKLPLKVIGTGTAEKKLKKIAGPTVEFLGYKSDEDVVRYIQQCRAFIFPGEEDFGIAPVEAQAAGRPVIAFGAGGALDTIVEGKTGLFFTQPTIESLAKKIQEFTQITFHKEACRKNAERFSCQEFKKNIREYVEAAVKRPRTFWQTR
jgi:glycosyltransferase involved in cell wall biosynthesis